MKIRSASIALAAFAFSVATPVAAQAATPTAAPTLPSACFGLATSSTGPVVGLGYCPAGSTPTAIPLLKTCIELGTVNGRAYGIGLCP